VIGPADAPVTLVEYSDFQCPTCAFYHPVLKRLKGEFGDRLRFVYRHFPLVRSHAHAMLAARAAEAAGRQGKFWEMHGLIFEGQKEWSAGKPREKFLEYARKLGLEMKRFEADLESAAVRDSVERARAEAERLMLSGTPTFFINGAEIGLPQSYGEFRKLIESELAAGG
jgi:protein-disulfide isomerase